METSKENPIVRYWQLIVVMVPLVFGGGSLYFQVNAMADELADAKAEEERKEVRRDITERKLTAIDERQKALTEDVQELKDSVKEQDKKLDKIIEKLNELD